MVRAKRHYCVEFSMPMAIPVILVAAGSLATAGAGIAGVATAIGLTAGTLAAIGAGLSIAGTIAGILLQPAPPSVKMEDGSAVIKQDLGPRVWGYGEYKLGGQFGYWNNDDSGNLRMWMIHTSHECDSVVEEWLDAERVQFDEIGDIDSEPWEYGGKSYIHRQTYLGAPTQVITGIGDEWDVNCKGYNLCSTFLRFSDGGTKTHQKIFTTGNDPKYNVVLRLAKIYDPRDPGQTFGDESSYLWSDNQALALLDFLTRAQPSVYGPIPIGFGYDMATEIDVDSFAAAADTCAELIPLKAGGFEPRYRSWGAFDGNERKKDILSSMLLNCDGRLTTATDGKLRLHVGPPDVPNVVIISDENIYSLQLKAGADQLDRINEVKANYVSKVLSWGQTECAAHADTDAIDRNGLETSSMKLRWCPSEGQAQRICAIKLKQNNPRFKGTITGDLALLNCWGERWLNLQCTEVPAFNGIYEISRPRFEFSDDAIVISYDISSYDNWYDWNAATDELDPPTIPDLDRVPTAVPVPTGVAVNIESRTLQNGVMAAVGVISWTAPTVETLAAYIRYREVLPGDVGIWQVLDADPGETSVDTPPLKDNTNYEAQVAFYGPRNSYSEFSVSVPFTAIANNVPAAVPYNLQANTAAANVTVSANSPNDWTSYGLRFYRNSVNVGSSATLIGGTNLAGPNQLVSIVDMPGPGDWYYFVESVNFSNVPSAKVGGVLAEVAPAAPVITVPSPPGPFNTYDRRQPVSGTGVNGATVTLYANAVSVGTAVVSGGTWAITPTTDLGIGVNSMTATQSIAGNTSVASGSLSLNVNALDTDAAAYIAAMSSTPSTARQALISTLFAGLKTDGIWTLTDGLLLAGHAEQAFRINGKNPAQIAVATGSPVYTIDSGYDGALSSDIDTGFNPSTAGGNYAQNSATLAVYGTRSVAGSAQPPVAIGTTGTSSGAYINPRGTTDQTSGRCNDAAGLANANTDTIGMFSVRRSGASAKQLDEEGVQTQTASTASTAITNATIRVLHGTGAAVSAIRVGAVFWGGYLDNTKILALRNRLHTYLQAIGAVS
jgi:hypothetical protein